jgi:hypothetical protein
MPINIHFTESDWEWIARDWTQWWEREFDRALVVLEITDPVPNADCSQLTKYCLDTPADRILNHQQNTGPSGGRSLPERSPPHTSLRK